MKLKPVYTIEYGFIACWIIMPILLFVECIIHIGFFSTIFFIVKLLVSVVVLFIVSWFILYIKHNRHKHY